MTRIAAFSDVHGNLSALEAVRAAVAKSSPDVVIVAGDHAINGPNPAEAVDALDDDRRVERLVEPGGLRAG